MKKNKKDDKLSEMSEEVKEIRLSDAFDLPAEKGKFEWTATLVNINRGVNQDLLSKCEALGDYLICDLGETPVEIIERVKALDRDTLKVWTKLAARADFMEEFLEKIHQQK